VRFAVVSTAAENGELASHMLPHTPRVAHGGDRVYFFYEISGGHDLSLNDGDGQPLIEVHNFGTLAEAEAWATANAREREALQSADGTAH
jgi:hypothetical protein